ASQAGHFGPGGIFQRGCSNVDFATWRVRVPSTGSGPSARQPERAGQHRTRRLTQPTLMLVVEGKPRPHNRSTQARSRPSNEYTRCSQGSQSLAAPTSLEG
ncbi:hypothetical protein N658DRAFT_500054, partial [Parathielavia hyrcaniae]